MVVTQFGWVLLVGLLGVVWGTPLDDYVWRPDPTYRWELQATKPDNNCTYYFIYLVSQTWSSETEVSQSVWWHHLTVVVPDTVEFYEYAAMLINGGSNRNSSSIPDTGDGDMIAMALAAESFGMPVALLSQIPNQPIIFYDDPELKPRREDDLIAWAWNECRLNHTGPEFLPRMPMTKASVRAMDTIAELMNAVDPRYTIDKFYITGASKRGWTTWTTAGIDFTRVVGFSPMVLSSVDFIPNINHHYRVMGGYSFALSDYFNMNLTCYLKDSSVKWWLDIVDPITYMDRYTMPKLVISATGDEFFLPDDSYYFWDRMPEPKYLNLIPNADHTMITGILNVVESQRAFWYSLVSYETGARITVFTDQVPKQVKVWSAQTLSTIRRDFRLAILNETNADEIILNPVFWSSSNATFVNDNEFYAEFSNPDEGWFGFFIQMQYYGPKEGILWDNIFTSEVMIIPNTLPFEDCNGLECCGKLV